MEETKVTKQYNKIRVTIVHRVIQSPNTQHIIPSDYSCITLLGGKAPREVSGRDRYQPAHRLWLFL